MLNYATMFLFLSNYIKANDVNGKLKLLPKIFAKIYVCVHIYFTLLL